MGKTWDFPLNKELFIKAWLTALGSSVEEKDREFVSVVAELINQAYLRGLEDAKRAA